MPDSQPQQLQRVLSRYRSFFSPPVRQSASSAVCQSAKSVNQSESVSPSAVFLPSASSAVCQSASPQIRKSFRESAIRCLRSVLKSDGAGGEHTVSTLYAEICVLQAWRKCQWHSKRFIVKNTLASATEPPHRPFPVHRHPPKQRHSTVKPETAPS